MASLSASDRARRRGVRRMKAVAAGFLVGATLLYAAASLLARNGEGWAGYLQAAAEAGMVGGLADWFAVTALFRHPLGLPIPHTAIIPSRKDALGHSLSDFVGENFLSAEVVTQRLRTVHIARRLAVWLEDPANVDRVTGAAATLLHSVLGALRDDDLGGVIGPPLLKRLAGIPVGPPLGRLLARVVEDGSHRGLVDALCRRAHDWVVDHQDVIERIVSDEAPPWSPRFVDRRVAVRLHRELVDFAAAVRDQPDHAARKALDTVLTDLADDLRHDPATIAQAERIKRDVLASQEVSDLLSSVAGAARAMIVEAVDEPEGELRRRLHDGVVRLGASLRDEERWGARIEGWVENAAVAIVRGYRDEITALITDTIATWDATETSRKIELHVGRDLQFIRINGTVVGALVGLLIYTLTRLS